VDPEHAQIESDGGKQCLPPGLVDAYVEAEFDVQLPGGTVTLVVGTAGHAEISSLPAVSLTVVTAYNPGLERPGDDANRSANERLEHYLLQLGKTYHPAEGRSRDRSHSEPSFAVEGLSRDDARAVGRHFHQACVFYWEAGRGQLLWCDGVADGCTAITAAVC
jgi:hypothetical protein